MRLGEGSSNFKSPGLAHLVDSTYKVSPTLWSEVFDYQKLRLGYKINRAAHGRKYCNAAGVLWSALAKDTVLTGHITTKIAP